ncbi:hypothetical protein [Klebsiella aerogenes]|uniref:hypothetical protein n=1 Tax=Klebsiella aerogenes TaxID=548 RepID=UPI001C7ED423|nr:hypothetical protein [Klebsiella aerogenes]HBQ0466801.1 hypothetical protein [Klebsiella aerogenes]HCB3012356.1 hypothetical protein [Klebsiella aerogenes]
MEGIVGVSTSKKIALVVIIAIGYFIGHGVNENNKYDELKSKKTSELSLDDKAFIKKIDEERAKAEADRHQYQIEQKKKEDADRPRRELMELQLAVRGACHETALSLLKHPDSYKDEQHEDGLDKQGDKTVYYFTLHYSGVNDFNVRSTSTIECYGTVGDKSQKVTYKTFN